jgi:DNA repair exonuclease SbcCD nuclease subunit
MIGQRRAGTASLEGEEAHAMPRLLHMADVHLGARHDDLGEAAARQRERQWQAFMRAIDVAVERRADIVLICGDLFDSNSQPRRSVERAATELGRLAERGTRTAIIPGTHDCYDATSIYRAFDLPQMAGLPPTSDLITVLTAERPTAVFPDLDLAVHGFVAPAKSRPDSPLLGFDPAAEPPARYRVGMIHGSLRIDGKVERDDVIFTSQEVGASGLHYLALGHWHSHREGRVAGTTWAYSGAPEPVALDQDGAGQVLLVTLEDGRPTPTIEPIAVGRTRFGRLDVDAASVPSQSDLVRHLHALADPDLVLDVRVIGVSPESLDLHVDEVEQQLQGAFFGLRVRDASQPALPDGPLPPPDTIAGAFTRDLQARVQAADAAGTEDAAVEAREALHLLRVLLDDPQRVTLV